MGGQSSCLGYWLQVWIDNDVFGNDSYLRVHETSIRMPAIVLCLAWTSLSACLGILLVYRCGKHLASGVRRAILSLGGSEKQREAAAELPWKCPSRDGASTERGGGGGG